VIQAPCNSSGSKGELGISSQFGVNFDFVAQRQATATRKSDLGAPRRVLPKRVALPRRRAWIVATTPKSWRKQTTALLSANQQRELHRRICLFSASVFFFGSAASGKAVSRISLERGVPQGSTLCFSLM